MTISPASTRVPVGLGVRYRAYVEFSDGSVSDVTHRLSTWSSSAPEIASVKGSKGLTVMYKATRLVELRLQHRFR